MSPKEIIIDSVPQHEHANASGKQKRKSRNFLKVILIALTTSLSAVRGENRSLMNLFGINFLVGASIATGSFNEQSSQDVVFDSIPSSSIFMTSKYSAEQSSTLQWNDDNLEYSAGYVASLAVDGNVTTCSSTEETTDQRWWKLTLGQTQLQIKGVSIRLSPKLPNAYQKFTIFVIDVSSGNRQSFIRCNQFSGYFPESKSKMIECIDNRAIGGNKVYIRDDRTGSRKLQLCEVEVVGPSSARPICEEPGKIKNGYITVINGSPDDDDENNNLQNDVQYEINDKYQENSQHRTLNSVELQQLEYKCNAGYVLWGNSRLVCQYNNSWSSQPPTCQLVSCGIPPAVSNTDLPIIKNQIRNATLSDSSKKATDVSDRSISKQGDTATYKCEDGFIMLANITEGKQNFVDHVKAICTNEGTWKMEFVSTCTNATDALGVASEPTSSNVSEDDAASLYIVWHAIMYLLIVLIVILLCCPVAYCCCYRRYRRQKIQRRMETEVTMPRLMDTSFHESLNDSGTKPLHMLITKGDAQKRYSNGGGTLQSILTVATSCGSSKNSLTSMQLQQSSQQQNNSKLASPSTSTDDKNARLSQDYDHNTNSKHNGGSHASNGELEVLNEVENENDIKIPESGSLIRGLSVDDSNSTTNVVFSQVEDVKNCEKTKYSTLNSCSNSEQHHITHFRSVNSPVPFPPPSISLPDTPLTQNTPGQLCGTIINRDSSVSPKQVNENARIPKGNSRNPFVFDIGNNEGSNVFLRNNNGAQTMMYSNKHHQYPSGEWQLMAPRRTNSNEDFPFGNQNVGYQHQNSLPAQFFNTIGHVNHHQHANYKQQLSVPYNCVNNNNFNQPQQLLISSQHYPSFDSILKAPSNFRDSALYSNDPSNPMFSYNVPQGVVDRNGEIQPVPVVDQRQNPQNYFYQPSYTNIPAMKTDMENNQDWPVIDEAGYASLIRKNKKQLPSTNIDEPVYEKIQETNNFRSNQGLNEGLDNFGSDSGTSSGIASSLNNRPDNSTQTYYQNFEDAVRDIQKLDNIQSTPYQRGKSEPHNNRKRLKPDLLQNTFNGKEAFCNNQASNNQRQNIYANDNFLPNEMNESQRFYKEKNTDASPEQPYQIYAQVNMAAKTNNNGKEIKKEAEKMIIELAKELSIAEQNDPNDDETEQRSSSDNIEELTREFNALGNENENLNGVSFEEIDAENNLLLAAIDTALDSKSDNDQNENQSLPQPFESESITITSNIDDFLSDVDVEYL